MRGVNDDEAADLAVLRAGRTGYELRFIEQMPLDAQQAWQREEMVTAEEILARLSAAVPLCRPTTRPAAARPPNGSGSTGTGSTVGVIAAVTRPFCGDCDRVRLTADGHVRNCLFAREETDLRTPLREGAADEVVALNGSGPSRSSVPGTASTTPRSCNPTDP